MSIEKMIRRWMETTDRVIYPMTAAERRKLKIEPERLRKIFRKALSIYQRNK